MLNQVIKLSDDMLTILQTLPPTGCSAIGGGQGRGHFCHLRGKKTSGKLSIILFFNFFFIFRAKEYYLTSLRSVHMRIFCFWLKYAFFVNSKHYLRSNGTERNNKARKYLLSEQCLTSSALGDMFFRRTRWIAAQSQEVHLIVNRS